MSRTGLSVTQLAELAGGLGVFLLGVVIMTQGLRGVAGPTLHRLLGRFTRSPASGALTGALSTAVLQSSSATTVAAVGFVGAGLLSFPQALGVIFGANLGTTVTGWLVAVLGFKLQLGQAVLPLILLGILLHLFAPRRAGQAGLALAGFGLIFVGISAMQAGMSGLEGQISFAGFAGDTLWGRLRLLLLGAVITLITQSSSAGVAAAITAVYTGTLEFEQAAAMVIGMDVGTTATALLATVGGSVEARRTGLSHVVYNLFTAVLALVLLTPYSLMLEYWSPGLVERDPELALVGFHSGFNLLSVLLILPWTGPFARLIEWLVPQRRAELLARLDPRLLREPPIALEAALASLSEVALRECAWGQALLGGLPTAQDEADRLAEAQAGLQRYLDQIHLEDATSPEWGLLNACLRTLDHLRRLQHRLVQFRGQPEPGFRGDAQSISAAVAEDLASFARGPHWDALAARGARRAAKVATQAEAVRDTVFAQVASGQVDIQQGNQQLEELRWLRRVARHLWRIAVHLEQAQSFSLSNHRSAARQTG